MVIEELIALYESGKSYEEISVLCGKSSKWVMTKLRGNITPRKPIRKTIIHEQILWNTIEERNELAVKLYVEDNIGAHVIGKKLNIAKKTVYGILKKNNIDIDSDRKYSIVSEFDVVRINERYDSGESLASIASSMSISSGTVRRLIHNRRNSSDANSVIPPHLQNEVVRLYVEDGLSSYKIADKFGWAYQSVQRFLARRKLTPQTGTKEWKIAVQRGIESGGSSLELKVEEILKKHHISYEKQYQLDEFRFDFCINNEVLVEIQGSYWHTKKQRRQRDLYKQKIARSHNKKLLVIWDYQLEDKNFILYKILNSISKPHLDLNTLSISKVSWLAAKELLSKWHYQKHGRSGHCYGVMHDGKLIAVAVYSTVTRLQMASKQKVNSGEILELTRFVIDPKYQARNFATWLISRSIKCIRSEFMNIKVLISFSDPTFGHDGTIYKASNWVFDGVAPASYWYYHRRENRIYHKKTIWNMASRSGLSEDDYAKKKHLLKVFGLPKNRYIFNIKR